MRRAMQFERAANLADCATLTSRSCRSTGHRALRLAAGGDAPASLSDHSGGAGSHMPPPATGTGGAQCQAQHTLAD